MPYDDQTPEGQEDEALRNELGDRYNNSPRAMRKDIKDDESGADDEETTKRRGLRLQDQAADEDDYEDVRNQIRAGYLKAREEDAAASGDEGEGGFFKSGKDKLKATTSSKSQSSSKRNKIIAGAGVGFITVIIGLIASFGSFFAVFKLDHILQSIDVKTFSRFNASFSGRSDAYFKAYLKMRLGEISNPDGSYNDTLLFKGDRVDTDNPIRDWYRTLRTGSFEKDLQKKTGIAFTGGSIRNANGTTTLKPVRLTFNNAEIAKLDPEASGLSKSTITKLKNGKLDNAALQDLNKIGAEAEKIVKTEVFDSSKTARKAIKEDLKKNTHFFNVIKRRHIRKDIQNKTGITSWKFFEKTRNKITSKKIAIQQKILKQILPSGKAGMYIGCILGSGPCNFNSDPSAPGNQANAPPTGEVDPDNKPDADPADLNEDGTPKTTTNADGKTIPIHAGDDTSAVANEIGDIIDEASSEELTDEAVSAAENEGLTLIEKQAVDEASSDAAAGTNPVSTVAKVWSWLQRIAKISDNIESGKFAKIISKARSDQLEAAYTIYSIARDHGKSGQLTGEEFGKFMDTLSDVGQSEGWINLNKPTSTNSVSAAATAETNVDKAAFCKMNIKEQKANKIHYFCASPNKNLAASLTEAYKDSAVCALICPIATVVRAVKSNFVTNFFSGIVNFIGSIGSNIVSALHIDDAFKAILSATGIGENIGKLILYGMTKVMTFLGAGPIFDGSPNSGATNYMLAGSAVTAESSTRDSGGVISTPTTIAYANNLAASYEKDQMNSQSLFERYASLSNTKSLFSTSLFSVTNFSISNGLTQVFKSLGTIPKTLASLVGGNASAVTNDFSPAAWAGVDTYDIPPACQTLDPLGTNYLIDAVGVIADSPKAGKAQSIVDSIRPGLTYDVERDSAKFWKLVYDKIGDDSEQEEIAGAIYNCALFDQRVMGGIGYTSGYSADGGLNDGSVANTDGSIPTPAPTPAEGTPGINAAGLNGYTIACQNQHLAYTSTSYGRVDWSKAPSGTNSSGETVNNSGSIGNNSANQPINVYIRNSCGAPARTIIVAGSIHGSENAGQKVAWNMLFNADLPQDVRVIAIPNINQSGSDSNKRVNANGVDLNRNQPFNWGANPSQCKGGGSESDKSCYFYHGTSAGSEPETQAVDAFLTSVGKTSFFVIYHDNLAYVGSVGNTSLELGKSYAGLVGMHGQCPEPPGNPSGQNCPIATVTQHGSLDGWYNSTTSTPSILVEMSSDQSDAVIKKHSDAIAAMLTAGTIK